MKLFTVSLMMVLAANAAPYTIASWSNSGTTFESTAGTNLYWTAESEWTAGMRNPAYWGEYMGWHEGAAFTEELYTYASLGSSLNLVWSDDFEITFSPKIALLDIAFFEELFMVIRALKWEEGNTCNYMGWYIETLHFYYDLAISTKECSFEFSDNFVDGEEMEYACSNKSYSVDEVRMIQLPLGYYAEGMYKWGYNTCQNFDEFNNHGKEFRGFFDGLLAYGKE